MSDPQFSVGQIVGETWRLLEPKPNGLWLAACSCGRTTHVNVHNVRYEAASGRPSKCLHCRREAQLRSRRPKRCKSCGATAPELFKKSNVTECERCARRRIRNGLCPLCSRPAFRRPVAGLWCVCGWGAVPASTRRRRSLGKKDKALRACRALQAVGVLPTRELVADIAGAPFAVATWAIGQTTPRPTWEAPRWSRPVRAKEVRAPVEKVAKPPKVAPPPRAPLPHRERKRPAYANADWSWVEPIAKRWLAGEKATPLAREFGVNPNTLRYALNRCGYFKMSEEERARQLAERRAPAWSPDVGGTR